MVDVEYYTFNIYHCFLIPGEVYLKRAILAETCVKFSDAIRGALNCKCFLEELSYRTVTISVLV